jgi:hypothetical protein
MPRLAAQRRAKGIQVGLECAGRTYCTSLCTREPQAPKFDSDTLLPSAEQWGEQRDQERREHDDARGSGKDFEGNGPDGFNDGVQEVPRHGNTCIKGITQCVETMLNGLGKGCDAYHATGHRTRRAEVFNPKS